MEVMKRIVRVIRANVNSLIASAEDPEKILEKTVLEMQENLMLLRQGVAQAIAIQKRTERQIQGAQSTAEEWYRRAQLALQQGNETLARSALTKRRVYQETATALFDQIQEQKDLVSKLKQDMQTLELKIAQAKTKKDMYIARSRSAEASFHLQELMNGVATTSSLNAFERMEAKVLLQEAKSEAMAQVGGDDLQQRFTALESTYDIDSELTAMKNTHLSQQLPKNQAP